MAGSGFHLARRGLIGAVAASLVSLGAAGCATVQRSDTASLPGFSTDEELREFLAPGGDLMVAARVPPPPAPPPPPSAPAPPGAAPSAPGPSAAPQESVTVSASVSTENDSITNVQVAGVDEGGIVKVSGDYLVILRRGRLFTVSTADGDLRAVDAIDAYPPGASARWDWYDEMLVSGDLIVVIGYSYRRGGTEINRFRLAADGTLSFIDSHHLRSDDYYSDRNYASRLIGDRLILYAPLSFQWNSRDVLDDMPGLSRWTPDREGPQFERIASASNVFIPAPLRAQSAEYVEAMHTVTQCDLAEPELRCKATVVLGPEARTFFVSGDSVYVWLNTYRRVEDDSLSFLVRIPLEAGPPSAVEVKGEPLDQFSFNANTAQSRIDVLVADEGYGDAMWNADLTRGRPALLRLPLSRFGDGGGAAPASDYQFLPGDEYAYLDRNRFVGDRLLYALSRWRDGKSDYSLVIVPVEGGEPVEFAVPEGIDRIEPVGRDAVVVGGRDAAVFLTVDLTDAQPSIIDRYVERGAREAESRSHAFFYNPDTASRDGADGLLGLPVINRGARAAGADMLFLRRDARRLSDYGRLESEAPAGVDDGCQASCVDWYGDARPIFLRGRVFALLGYELVEGDASGARIRETRRIDYTPQPERRAGK
ncbi:beta-propeller domain-containing protein [Hyphomonadaceae bacterium BL14]|nr:beta-propeller domain-containing protein [Hyphomonadaceae bacterium BL14]